MDFLRSHARRFRPWRTSICETKSAPSSFARPSRRIYPGTRALRRLRNGHPCCRSCSRRSRTRPGTRGDVAEADQNETFQGLEVILAEAHSIPKFHGELFFRSGNAVV